jgi:hypothetical protein
MLKFLARQTRVFYTIYDSSKVSIHELQIYKQHTTTSPGLSDQAQISSTCEYYLSP